MILISNSNSISDNYKQIQEQTEEHTTISNNEEEKQATEFKSVYEILQNLEKYRSAFDQKNEC